MSLKPFAWSISRLGSFETCPRRHHEVDLLKNFAEGPNAQRDFGGDLHKALEEACRDNVPLPPHFEGYQWVVDKILALPGAKKFEQKWGIDRNFGQVGFFDNACWLRVVIDVFIRVGDRAAVVDYKTGKVKEDMSQLLLNAAVIFAYFPQVNTVDVAYWWICQKRKVTRGTYHRADLPQIWNKFLPRAKAYEDAYTKGEFFANPSGLCKRYCPVTTCQFHGGN
jgi:hypothetical protein